MTDTGSQRSCFHCGLPVPDDVDLQVTILGEARPMCCAGCEAVARAIVDNQLENFYQHRTANSRTPEALVPEALRELTLYDDERLQASFVHALEGERREASLILEGITCAACVWLNERHVQALDGVIRFQVNYSNHRAQLVWDNGKLHLSDVLKAISEIGYHAHPFDPGRQEELHKQERRLAIRRLGVAGVGMMQVMMMAVAMYLGDSQGMTGGIRSLLRWASLVVATPVVFYSAQPFFRSAWRDLKFRQLGMDVPVSLAIGAAYIASAWATLRGHGEVYFDSVTMFTFFLLLGRFLELSARHKAGQVADELVRMLPATAHRKTMDGLETVPVIELAVGDEIVIKPGETAPADGIIVAGRSTIDESLLTGESLPVSKSIGDMVIGGTINRASPLTVRLDKLGQETVLAGISRLLERAQAEKPQMAQFANRVAGWFVAGLLVVASLVFIYWYLHAPDKALWITLSVLVITCPCALSLATPVAMTATVGVLTRMGILTTRGHALETLAKVTDIVFDKTGTLTRGKLSLSGVTLYHDMPEAEVRALAAGLEKFSEHPVAQAIVAGAESPAEVEIIESETGLGILGRYQGELVRIGNLAWVQQWHPDFDDESPPGASVYLALRDAVVARLELRDELRPEAGAALRALKSLGITPHLLSGDNEAAVAAVARALGIEHYQARQLPDDKLAAVRHLQQQGGIVAMVGDGVNDAPVLAGADVSIAMGSGAQLAQASADMVLLTEDLERLPQAVVRARATLKIVRQNFAWAILYNLFAMPLAAAGYIAPWMAAIGMSFSSLFVVLNALRLRAGREKPEV